MVVLDDEGFNVPVTEKLTFSGGVTG